jgi:oligosaccharide repeat unit polymerase
MTLLLAVLIFLMPLVCGVKFGTIPLISPMHFVAYFAFFGTTFKVVVASLLGVSGAHSLFTSNSSAEIFGLTYLLVFMIFLCFGYISVAKYRVRARRVLISEQEALSLRNSSTYILVSALFFFFVVNSIISGRGYSSLDFDTVIGLNNAKWTFSDESEIGSTNAAIKTLFSIPKMLVLASFAVMIASANLRNSFRFLTLLVLVIASSILSGDRFELIDTFVFLICVYYMMGKRINTRQAIKVLVALIGVVSVGAFMTVLRTGQVDEVTIGSAFLLLFQTIAFSTYFLDYNVAIVVVDKVSFHDLYWGETYFRWLYGWIPRSIWPDKPAIDLGIALKRDVFGLMGAGGINVTGPGEAFMNFGWGGVAVAYILGAVYRISEVATLRSSRSPTWMRVWLYPLMVYPFVQATLQSSFSSSVVGLGAQLALLIVVGWVLMSKRFSLGRPL